MIGILGKLIFFLLILIFVSACSTLQPLDSRVSNEELIKEIKFGDQLEIKTSSGELKLIEVTAVSDGFIKSGDEQFAVDEIEIIAYRKLSGAERAGEVAVEVANVSGVTTVLGYGLIALILVVIAL